MLARRKAAASWAAAAAIESTTCHNLRSLLTGPGTVLVQDVTISRALSSDSWSMLSIGSSLILPNVSVPASTPTALTACPASFSSRPLVHVVQDACGTVCSKQATCHSSSGRAMIVERFRKHPLLASVHFARSFASSSVAAAAAVADGPGGELPPPPGAKVETARGWEGLVLPKRLKKRATRKEKGDWKGLGEELKSLPPMDSFINHIYDLREAVIPNDPKDDFRFLRELELVRRIAAQAAELDAKASLSGDVEEDESEGPRICRWESVVVVSPGTNSFHPKNRKIKMSVRVSDLGLTKEEEVALIELSASRYNPRTGDLTITSEKHSSKEANRRDIMRTLHRLLEASKDGNVQRQAVEQVREREDKRARGLLR